jgi:hypothetical protein
MASKLLLSNAKGYGLSQIKNWSLSALKHQTDYDIGLVLMEPNEEITSFCALKGIRIFSFYDQKIPEGEDYFYYRCKLVSKALKSVVNEYEYAICTDVRDVIFQEDPFPKFIARLGDKDAVFSSENILIQNEPWNQNVLFQIFGGEVCDQIRHLDVVNSGVMFGKTDFLAEVNRLMYDVCHRNSGEKIRDQAALQYVYFTLNLIKDRAVLSTGEDFIATHLAVAGPTEFWHNWGFKNSLKSGHVILNKEENKFTHPDGQLYSIIHQYTRIPEWSQFVDDMFDASAQEVVEEMRTVVSLQDAKVAAVVCSTDGYNTNFGYYGWNTVIPTYERLALLYDVTRKVDLKQEIKYQFLQENLLYYDLASLERTFNRTEPPDLKHRWADGGSRNINWFFPHLRMLYYFLAHPNYDYYWFMDDDCGFVDGDINEFLRATSFIDADLVITYIFTDGNEKQEGTHFASEGMSCYHGDHCAWFHWYPGPGDKMPDGVTKKYGSYFPFVRLSKAALHKLWELHQQGYIGYSEGYVPSVLNHFGFKIHSLNKKDAALNTPCNTNVKIMHKRSTVKWTDL